MLLHVLILNKNKQIQLLPDKTFAHCILVMNPTKAFYSMIVRFTRPSVLFWAVYIHHTPLHGSNGD